MRNNAFEGCWNLDTIRVYSDSVPTLASNAFRFLPKTCKKVNERAMQECEGMETLVLGDGMENRRMGAEKCDVICISLGYFLILRPKSDNKP